MVDISVIIPVYNGEKWITSCMKSIAEQTILDYNLKIEIVACNDGSNDNTPILLKKWQENFSRRQINFTIFSYQKSKGVGAAKNAAVNNSVGEFLCFQDIDDLMQRDRLLSQWKAAFYNHNALVGSKISRTPVNSTPRLTRWVNSLTPQQLKLQIYTSNGPTILMPTWFCHRSVFDKVGGFDETGHGTPEDLIFFYKHLDLNGDIIRVDEELLIYTYHREATTFSVKRDHIWRIQLRRLENIIFPEWDKFIIWNAGKAGRRVVRALSQSSLEKVTAFCDVDKKKVGRLIELYCPVERKVIKKVPVIHFNEAVPPLLICVKFDLTNGQFENNLKSMNLSEGRDYILFN
ncbi:UDP-GlcNAc:betaGal beta-1,3-N-acetylglucosaminyltransferase-like protein 1 [Amyelois transitella]|uniref:UDP-GlcNAc:betaGal beta-1,3-N-acetylglucosaminyltransferase-like protein 1 n=1 Tax=Amyelois transitella TaxID=680683 RepID=UPI00067C1168|nr:UDP-GlcNAc:betaGal beta-1,3-N-acetylglucosaminyltransferase-like protein 1 [Amyelois transitella]